METLCKLYLELANVVPRDCVSSREIYNKRKLDKYGVALMMIREGVENPQEVAQEILQQFSTE